LQPRKW